MNEWHNPETETLESDVNSLRIIRNENVMESYSVSSSRLGYLSEASNTITVAPDAGIFTMNDAAPVNVETDSRGFRIVGNVDCIDVTVYDMAGRLVFATDSLAPGVCVSLPSGLYLLRSNYLNLPFKILIP